MIYAVIIVALLSWAFTTFILVRALVRQSQDSQTERRELEDRLMALTQPISLTHVEGVRNHVDGQVKYVDEEREAELERS